MSWNQPAPVMLLKNIELPDFVMINFSVIAVEQVEHLQLLVQLPLPNLALSSWLVG
jgi:hypothetical protein